MSTNIISTPEIQAMSRAEISPAIQTYLQQESILINLVQDFSYLVTKGSKSVTPPRSGGFSVKRKQSNTQTDVQSVTYSGDTINLTNHDYIQWENEEIAESQSVPDLVADETLKATADLGYDFDLKVVEQFKSASSTSPDHAVSFAGSTLARADILTARKLLLDQKIKPVPGRIKMGVGPLREKEMLNIDDFIDASKFGSNIPVSNGQIGRVFGMDVYVSTAFENDVFYWVEDAVGQAWQRRLTFDMQKDLRNLGMLYSLDWRYGVSILDSGKRVVYQSTDNA